VIAEVICGVDEDSERYSILSAVGLSSLRYVSHQTSGNGYG